MGICASNTSSEIHDNCYYGHENAVHYTENSTGIDKRIGSTYSYTGSKGLNQDSAIIFQGYGLEDVILCGVFDGHGRNGYTISMIVRNRLPSLILNQLRNSIVTSSMPSKSQWKEAFISAFKSMDKEIKSLHNCDCSCSGAAAVVVVKQGEVLVIANLGDSRAILGTRTENGMAAVQLTTDFKPEVPTELDRIIKCNGRVFPLKSDSPIQRVWLPYVDSPGLAMSRAFGDFLLKNHGVIATPEISYHRVSEDDMFLVLASDGVWDVLTNDDVISIVSASANEESAAQGVVNAAIAAWKCKFSNDKRDDCTVVCLFLQIKKQ